MMDSIVQRYASLSVPRYACYPAAAEFTASVGAVEQSRWLETLGPGQYISLYFHVPYRRETDQSCGCWTKMALRDEALANYQRVLREEIDQVGRRLARGGRVSRLRWGGGAPGPMRPEALAAILKALSAYFAFAPGFEHSIALDPRDVTRDAASSLADLGVHRVSLGVRDLDSAVQRAIGRSPPLSTVSEAFEALRRAGIENIDVDLVYGLPPRTAESLAAMARQVAALGVDRVACHEYAHRQKRTRDQRLIDTAPPPTAIERFAQARSVSAAFAAEGYQAIGIDHFARPDDALAVAARAGRLHRDLQGYTDDEATTLIGFGASAISRLEVGFTQNIADPLAYAHAIGGGRLAAARGHRFTPDDFARGTIIERLMCEFRADLQPIGGADRFLDELALLRPMIRDGIVTYVEGAVQMTSVGRPFVRVVASIFDAFRQDASGDFDLAM